MPFDNGENVEEQEFHRLLKDTVFAKFDNQIYIQALCILLLKNNNRIELPLTDLAEFQSKEVDLGYEINNAENKLILTVTPVRQALEEKT